MITVLAPTAVCAIVRRVGPLAQLEEQRTFNPRVVGSSPTRPTIEFRFPPGKIRVWRASGVGRLLLPGRDSRSVLVQIWYNLRKMGSITKRDGAQGVRYMVRVRRDGTRKTKTFARKRDAEAWARQVEAEIDRGEAIPDSPAVLHTVRDLAQRYSKEKIPERSARDRPRLRVQLELIVAELGHLRLADLEPRHCIEFRRRLAEGLTGNEISPATQNRYLALLSSMCSTAVREWHLMPENPVAKVVKKKEPKGRVRFLSREEQGRLLEACEKRNQRLYLFVLLAISTGGRKGEILGLRWKDVELGNGRDQGRVVFEDTKNGDRRGVPLTGKALEELRVYRQERHDKLSPGHLILWPSGRNQRTAAAEAPFPSRQWYGALRDAEIEDFRVHDLRHTAASYLLMSGATLGELAAYLGHKSLAMVQRYAHLAPEHLNEVSRRMTAKWVGDDGEAEAASLTIRLPLELRNLVEERVRAGDYGSGEELVLDLVRTYLMPQDEY